jgi:uncharacterized protein involved in outer membrane biogenesis
MKTLLKIITIFLLIVLLAGAGLVYYVRNADYRTQIEEAVAEATGFELIIGGDLDLSFLPNLGFTLGDVRLRNPALNQELLSTSRMVLQVDFRELIGGRVQVRELLASNFHVNYFINAQGVSNWQPTSSNTQATSSASSSGGSSNLSPLTIDQITIENTSIDYQDLSSGTRYQIDNFNLISRDTNLNGRPFDFEITLDFENNGMSAAIPVSLRSNIIIDLDRGNLNFNNIALSVTPMLMQGELTVANLLNNPQFSGNLHADPFDLRGLLQTFAVIPEADALATPNLESQQLASFQAQFSGNTTEATVPSLVLTLGETSIEANGSVRFADQLGQTNVSYSISGGDIDLTPFLAGNDEQTEIEVEPAATPTAESSDTELPVDALRTMNLLGSVSLASVTVNDLRFDDINLFTNIEDGVLDLELTPVSVFDGSLQGSLRLDGSSQNAALATQFSINSVNLAQLAPSVSRFSSVTGNLNVESSHTASGNTVNALRDTLNGSTTFTITDNSVDIGLVKQVFTAIAALSPTGEAIQQWPDVIRFSEMGGYLTLEQGLAANQEMKLRMDNFDITGTGGVDLDAGTFDYDLLFTVLGAPFTQTIPINSLYHDVSWPVACSANFSDDVSQYCSPDFTQVRQIFTQIGTSAVRSRLQEVISDQVPENIQESARGLLNNLFDGR